MRLRPKRPFLFVGTLSLLVAWLTLAGAFAAANIVPVTGLGYSVLPVTAAALKPPECAGIPVNTIVSLAAGETPTAGNDLILGTAGSDSANGGLGQDCILGGDGVDFLYGGAGGDVIVSTSGIVLISGDGGTDTCYAPLTLFNLFLVDCENIVWR